MKESLQLLEEAEKKYQSAVDNIEGVNIKLRDFDRELKKNSLRRGPTGPSSLAPATQKKMRFPANN